MGSSGMSCSSETSVLKRATRRNIPEDTILNSKMDIGERGGGGVGCIGLVQDRDKRRGLGNAVINLSKPLDLVSSL
jgi:hypothetical protein